MLLHQAAVRREISIHNRVHHKAAGDHWNSPHRNDPGYLKLLESALPAAPHYTVPAAG